MPVTVHSAGRGNLGATLQDLDKVSRNLQVLPVELRNRYRETAFRIVQREIVPEAKRLCPPYPDRRLKSGKSRATGASRRSIRAAVNRQHGVHLAVGGSRGSARSGWYIAFEIYGVAAYGRAKNPFPFVAVRRRERYVVQEVRRETRELEVELQRALAQRGSGTIRKVRPPGGRVSTAGAPRKVFDATKPQVGANEMKALHAKLDAAKASGKINRPTGGYDFFKKR